MAKHQWTSQKFSWDENWYEETWQEEEPWYEEPWQEDANVNNLAHDDSWYDDAWYEDAWTDADWYDEAEGTEGVPKEETSPEKAGKVAAVTWICEDEVEDLSATSFRLGSLNLITNVLGRLLHEDGDELPSLASSSDSA